MEYLRDKAKSRARDGAWRKGEWADASPSASTPGNEPEQANIPRTLGAFLPDATVALRVRAHARFHESIRHLRYSRNYAYKI